VRMADDRDGKWVPATVPGASVRGTREQPIRASLWRYLGYFVGVCECTNGVGVNYWGLRIRMDGVLAPWGKPTVHHLIAHNPKMSFLGFYQLILGFGVSRRNRPSVTRGKHEMSKKGAR
jgi:hypothetical protein